jgi:class 3 adenylate cyclase
VLDAVGAERTALLGVSEGVPMCALFAATYPARTQALVLYGGYARRMTAPDYPWGLTDDEHHAFLEEIERDWGGPVGLEVRAPSAANDERFREWWARYLRVGASPSAVLALSRMNAQIDVRPALAAISSPTLIIHRPGDQAIRPGGSRWMAERIRGARLFEPGGDDHLPWVGDQDAVLSEIEEFLTGARPVEDPDRVLATVLFTDIVGSTARAVKMGDRQWMDALEAHQTMVRWFLERYRGREVDTAGDSFFATFDGPARAIRCALAVRDASREKDIDIRAGLHTGEVELGEKPGGIAVHIGARVMAEAGAGEVLVSQTVRDLVAGSGLTFEERGPRALKGVPGLWDLFLARS